MALNNIDTVTRKFSVDNDTQLKQLLSDVSDRKIYFSLCEKNQQELKSRPYRLTADGEYAIVYQVLMEHNSLGVKNLVVNNRLAKEMGYDESKLYELAMKNTPEIFPAQIISIKEEMKKDFGVETGTGSLNEILAAPDMDNIFIVSNEDIILGAGAMYYDDHKVLNEIAEKLQENLIVLPSSIHEVIVIPDDGRMKVSEIKEMICNVNLEGVAPKERLGWKPLRFDRESCVLSLAEERKEPVVSQKQKREPVHKQMKRGGR